MTSRPRTSFAALAQPVEERLVGEAVALVAVDVGERHAQRIELALRQRGQRLPLHRLAEGLRKGEFKSVQRSRQRHGAGICLVSRRPRAWPRRAAGPGAAGTSRSPQASRPWPFAISVAYIKQGSGLPGPSQRRPGRGRRNSRQKRIVPSRAAKPVFAWRRGDRPGYNLRHHTTPGGTLAPDPGKRPKSPDCS